MGLSATRLQWRAAVAAVEHKEVRRLRVAEADVERVVAGAGVAGAELAVNQRKWGKVLKGKGTQSLVRVAQEIRL